MPEHLLSTVKDYITSHWFEVSTFIFGTILAIYTFKRSQKKKQLSYTTRTFNLIDENFRKEDDIEVYYKKERVANLSVTNFILWNNGTETVNGVEMAKNDKLRIETSKGNIILDYKPLNVVNNANDITLTTVKESNSLEITFDYIDPKEGFVTQIYHTGAKENDIILKGALRGMSKINYIYDYSDVTETIVRGRFEGVRTFLIRFIPFVLLLTMAYYQNKVEENSNGWNTMVWSLITFCGAFLVYAEYRINIIRLPRSFEKVLKRK